jgi:putative hydrolase of the HAD superfamily
MHRNYRHIFFDLDHTLWDFERNSRHAISELYHLFDFSRWQLFSLNDLVNMFHEVNNWLWEQYNKGLIDRLELRNTRFRIVLDKLGLRPHQIPGEIGIKYLEICPRQPHVIPHAHEILHYLKDRYPLHIITNGFNDVQLIKLKSADLLHYFDKIITSDMSGFRKPQRDIFEYALATTGAQRHRSIMIGDNLEADIAGARNASLDQVFFNAPGVEHSENVTFEIQHLEELRNIL